MQTTLALLPGFLDRLLHLNQQGFHLCSPGLLLLLEDSGQFSEVMGIAQRVRTGVSTVGAPAVMDGATPEPREDADGFEGSLASLGMALLLGEAARAGTT